MVKNWDFGAPLSPAPTQTLYEWAGDPPVQARAVDYAYIMASDALPAPEGTAVPAGILPGQGNPTTPKAFNAHWITKVGDAYYDPSYGTLKISAQNPADYENAAFAGYKAPGLSSAVRANPAECDVVFADADADAADFSRVPDVCAEIDGDFYVWASGFPEQGIIADGEKSKLHSWEKGVVFGEISRIENPDRPPLRNCLPPGNLQEEPLAAGTPEDEAVIRAFVAAQAPYFFVREEKENPEKFKIRAEDFCPALTGKTLLAYFRTAFSPDQALGEMHIVCREENGFFYVWRRGDAKTGFVVRKTDRSCCAWNVGTVIRP